MTLLANADHEEYQRLLRESQAERKRLIRKTQRLHRLLLADEKYRERLEGTRVRAT